MRCWSVVVALACSAPLAGCGDAVTLEIASDRPVPAALSGMCVGISDASGESGAFGQAYRLGEGGIGALPQTLRVESGHATAALAWVRGDEAGVPVARRSIAIDFARDRRLVMDRCERGAGGVPAPVGAATGILDARLVASMGAGGQVVVAVAEGRAIVLDAKRGALDANDAPMPPPGPIVALVAADLDGDCDDDIVVATANAAPAIWRREGKTFVEAGALGTAAAAAIATGDVDRDLDTDLVTGSGGTLALWRNDGSGMFAVDPPALGSAGHVTAVSALALGDLDRDGVPDLLVGQAREPLQAWLGEPDGTGSFLFAPAVAPPVPLDATRIALGDADSDLDPDVVVSVSDGPARLYIDREGRLEDQTYVRIPAPAAATAVALGGWDPGCEADAVFAGPAGTVALRGQDGGTFVADASLPAASDVVFVDLDDDGDLDAVLETSLGAVWIAR